MNAGALTPRPRKPALSRPEPNYCLQKRRQATFANEPSSVAPLYRSCLDP